MINKTKDYLTTPNAVKISNKNVNNINFDNILAFSYGGPGAMGEPGHLIIVEKNKRLKFYESNLVYNKDEENEYTLYSYYALEAKLVCGNMTFSLATEFVENETYTDNDGKTYRKFDKQDCELKAAYRLLEKIKKNFP